MLMKSWQQQGLKREPMMQGKRPNTVVVLFLHAHKLALPESRSLSQRAPTWMIGQDSVCIWYVVSFRQNCTDGPVAQRGGAMKARFRPWWQNLFICYNYSSIFLLF